MHKDIKKNYEKLEIVEQSIKDVDTKLNDHILTAKSLIDTNEKNHQLLFQATYQINEKLDTILNVRVNGTVGLENALRSLYEVTSSSRSNKQLSKAVRNWIDKHKVLSTLLSSRIFIGTTIIFSVWFILSILQLMGVDINAVDIFKKLLIKFSTFH